MQVFQYEQQRLALRGTTHEFAEAVPHITASQLRRQLDRCWDVRKGAPQRRCDTGDFRGNVAKRLAKRDRAPRAADRLLDDLDIRQIRRGAAHLQAVAGKHPHAMSLGLVANFGSKS